MCSHGYLRLNDCTVQSIGAASMIKAIQAKPITGMTFSPTSAQESQSESVAAPAEVGQGLGTHHDLCECRSCISKSPTCAACGSTNTEPCCHPAEFCQAICNDCNTPLNADGSLWKDQTESRFFVPVGAVVLGTFIRDGVSFPYGSVDGGYFLSDEFGWGWWPELLQMLGVLSQRLEQGA